MIQAVYLGQASRVKLSNLTFLVATVNVFYFSLHRSYILPFEMGFRLYCMRLNCQRQAISEGPHNKLQLCAKLLFWQNRKYQLNNAFECWAHLDAHTPLLLVDPSNFILLILFDHTECDCVMRQLINRAPFYIKYWTTTNTRLFQRCNVLCFSFLT